MIKLLCTALSTVRRSNNRRPWSRQYLALFCYSPSFSFDARQWILRLVPLLLLPIWLPAQAANNYTFPGNIPAVCTGPSSGVYTCTPLTLDASDTITITEPTAITVSGDFTTGSATQINEAGNSDLTITVTGITDLGANTILKGNIIGSNTTTGTITIGANSQVEGDLTTTEAGVINIGSDSSVVGNLNTQSGAINVGDRSTVTGLISSSLAGVITIGDDSVVVGDLNTLSGAINAGDRVTITGSILSSLAGVITVGADAIVTGDIATTYEGSEIGAGAITIGASANVGGNVETATAGAITVGALANVTGGATVHKAGALTIGANSTVGERISTSCEVVTPPTSLPRIISRQWRQVFMR